MVWQDKDMKAAEQARSANQKALLARGLLDQLLALSLAEGGVSAQPVRCQVTHRRKAQHI